MLLFPCTKRSNMIKKIHYVWLGQNPKDKFVLEKIESWKKFCPDYEIIEWNETNFDLNTCKYALDAYNQKKYAFASDYIRIKVLNEFGGLYLDTDVELIKPVDEILQGNKSVIGFETKSYLATNFIYAEPHQEWLEKLLKYYQKTDFVLKKSKNTNKNNEKSKKKVKLNLLPNTYLVTAFLNKYNGLKLCSQEQLLDDGIKVYPQDYFSPKDMQTREVILSPNTVSVHHFSASWTGENFNKQQKFVRGVRKVFGIKMFSRFEKMYTKIMVKKIKKII